MTEQELLDLKKKIAEAKTEEAELQGTKKQLMKQLESQWECTTIEQAQEKLSELETEQGQLQSDIDSKTIALVTKYELE